MVRGFLEDSNYVEGRWLSSSAVVMIRIGFRCLTSKEFVQHFRNPKQVKANCGEPHEILKISQLKLVVYRCQTLTFLPNHCSVFDVVRTFSFLDGEKESSAQATSNK